MLSENPRTMLAVALATGRTYHAGMVKDDDSHEKRDPGPPGWGWQPSPIKNNFVQKAKPMKAGQLSRRQHKQRLENKIYWVLTGILEISLKLKHWITWKEQGQYRYCNTWNKVEKEQKVMRSVIL